MVFTQREVGDVVILRPHGKMELGDGDEKLLHSVNALLERGLNKIVIDMSDCPYIDSSVMQTLVRCYTLTGRAGGGLHLLNLPQRVVDFLQMTKLNTVFSVHTNETEALKSFGPQPQEGV